MTDLKTLKEDLRKKQWSEIAEDLIKYQNYKTGVAIRHIRGDVSDTTKKNYITSARYYLRTGKKYESVNVGTALFEALDEALKKHVQPLTPKQEEQARLLGVRKPNYTKKDAEVPITQVIPKKITSKFEYGVKYGKLIYLQDSEKEAQIFLERIKATGNSASIVSVEINEETDSLQ